jgi:putative two-component system response regulator
MVLEELSNSRILIVDDDEDNLALLELTLNEAGARFLTTVSRPQDAPAVYEEFKPDVVLLDLWMPPVDGFYLMQQFQAIDGRERSVPIVMLTGDESEATKQRALESGVAEFLHKKFDMVELLLRLRNVLRAQQLYRQVQRQKSWLEETVRVRTRQLQAARREVLERLALAAEFRDDQTGEHTRRVGQLCAQIAQAMGEDPTFVEALGSAALLHDLGKIGIPDGLLRKTGPLTPEERTVMQEHTLIGATILTDCTEPVMRMARELALTHHERWDGAGYPHGLMGDDIPISGRIVSVADAFDAMISERPYKAPVLRSQAIHEIVACSGKQFDPEVVKAFLVVQQTQSDLQPIPLKIQLLKQPELTFEA